MALSSGILDHSTILVVHNRLGLGRLLHEFYSLHKPFDFVPPDEFRIR